MKPRRDITLGEMQDECRCREDCGDCPYVCLCAGSMVQFEEDEDGYTYGCRSMPSTWDLTDPPRFTEAQMALLKVFYNRGFRKVITGSTSDALIDCLREFLGVGQDVTLDLAELLGKDGAE